MKKESHVQEVKKGKAEHIVYVVALSLFMLGMIAVGLARRDRAGRT